MKKFAYLLFFYLLFCNIETKAQQYQNIINEDIVTFKHFIVRLRPVQYSYRPNGAEFFRNDVLVGKKLLSFLYVYGYWNLDNKNRHRLGIRTDLTNTWLDEKLTTTFQFRYFWSMNSYTTKQYLMFPTFDYKILPFLKIGIWNMSIKEEGKIMNVYTGPLVNILFTKKVGWFIAYTKDLNSPNNVYLLHTILYFKLDLSNL